MFSYVDIIRRQNELKEKNEKLQIDRNDLIAPLYNLRNQYPEIFNILPNNFNNVDPDRIDARLEFLIEDVENSLIEETIKENIINLINDIRKELKVINNKQRMYDRFLNESVEPEKLKRENYLEDIYNETAQIKENIEKLEKEIEDYKKEFQLGIDKNYEKEILNTFNSVIIKKENEIRNLKNRVREIYKEPGLIEEIALYKEEKSKPKKQYVEKVEEPKNVKKTDTINTPSTVKEKFDKVLDEYKKEIIDLKEHTFEEQNEDIDELIDDEKKIISEDNKVEKEIETIEKIDKERLAPLIPERVKRVIEKHKPSKELIDNIKKYGAPLLGAATIGVAATMLSLNPALTAVTMGATGLIIDKEIKNKGRLK